MLTIAKLGQWSVSYYVDTARSAVAAGLESRAAGGGLGEYYSESETRLPVWIVAGRDARAAMGLTGVERVGENADLDVVTRWLDEGVAPGGAVGSAFAKGRAVHGFDLTFCAPKSVSLLRGLGDDVTGKAVAVAHTHAIAEAMEYLGEHAGYTRVLNRESGRQNLVRLPGIAAAAFQHETSRAGDPHLHTHVLVPNRQARADGRLVSLDSVSLYHEARGAGAIYQATLRRELTRLLGVGWAEVDPRTGMADIAGVDSATITAWSQRKTAMKEWAAEHLIITDTVTVEQLATAQKATRPSKPEGIAWAQLRAQWAADSRRFTVERDTQIAAIARQAHRRSRGDIAAAAVAAMPAAAFTRADLIEALSAQLGATDTGDVSPRELVEAVADEVAVRLTDPRAPHQREGSVRYSAAELIAEEAAILAVMGSADERARIPISAADTEGLSADQGAAITAIASSERLVQPLSAPAGAGKTHSLKVLRAAANRAGKRVLLVAPTGRAVHVALREHAGDSGSTVHRLVGELERGRVQLDSDTVVVVDEAAMVGADKWRALLEAAAAAGSKVVLVGDAQQLSPVAARGGTFAGLCADLPWSRQLCEVWRMTDPEERAASLAARHGGGAALRHAVGWYRRHDRLHTGDAVTMADDAVTDWRADRDAGRDVLLLADRWEVVDALNTRIQGELIGPEAARIPAARGHHLARGDIVITRRNTDSVPVYTDSTWATRADPVRNGQRWQVQNIDADGDRLRMRRLDDDAIAIVPGKYLRRHVHLGYAITVHAAQGATTDNCRAIISAERAARDSAYVALTRGRSVNSLYIYDTAVGEADHEHRQPAEGVHIARRGTPAQAGIALRHILGRDHRTQTIAATAEASALPPLVADLRQRHAATVEQLRREHRTAAGGDLAERMPNGLTAEEHQWLLDQRKGRRPTSRVDGNAVPDGLTAEDHQWLLDQLKRRRSTSRDGRDYGRGR